MDVEYNGKNYLKRIMKIAKGNKEKRQSFGIKPYNKVGNLSNIFGT